MPTGQCNPDKSSVSFSSQVILVSFKMSVNTKQHSAIRQRTRASLPLTAFHIQQHSFAFKSNPTHLQKTKVISKWQVEKFWAPVCYPDKSSFAYLFFPSLPWPTDLELLASSDPPAHIPQESGNVSWSCYLKTPTTKRSLFSRQMHAQKIQTEA